VRKLVQNGEGATAAVEQDQAGSGPLDHEAQAEDERQRSEAHCRSAEEEMGGDQESDLSRKRS